MNRQSLRPFPYTLVALALALMVLVAASLWKIDVFEMPGLNIVGIEHSEIGQIIIAFLLIIPALFIDRVVSRQRMHEAQIRAEQLRVLHVTIRTVQDIVNNNLNQLQLLRFEAEGHVPAETLTLFDATILDTAAQLTALGNMKVFAEKPMAAGSGLDPGTSVVPG